METIIGVVIGGVLAIAGGIIGSLIQTSRDHAKWVRERRYEALFGLIEMVDSDAYRIRLKLKHDTSPDAMVAMQRVATKVAFIGSEKMREATDGLRNALVALSEDGDSDRFELARSVYLLEAQKVLGTTR